MVKITMNNDNQLLEKLRSSVGQVSTTGRSKATAFPLDDQDEVVMGSSIEGRRERRRPARRAVPSEDLTAPLPIDDEDEESSQKGAVDDELKKAKDELSKAATEKKTALDKVADLEKQLKRSKEELEESQESVSVFEEMMREMTKKEENEPQDVIDIFYEFKAKAKAFDVANEELKKTKEKLAGLEKELAEAKKKVTDSEEALKKASVKPETSSSVAPVQADPKAEAEQKAKYEKALKDLDEATSKVAGLESLVKAKEAEIADLKERLNTALVAPVSTVAGSADINLDNDPIVSMVEKLIKEMEEVALENEQYLSKLEAELFPEGKPAETDTATKVEQTEKAAEVSSPVAPPAAATKSSALVNPPKEASAQAKAPLDKQAPTAQSTGKK